MQTASVTHTTETHRGQTYSRGNLYAVIELSDTENLPVDCQAIIDQLESLYIADPPRTLDDVRALIQSMRIPPHGALTIVVISDNHIHIAGNNGGVFIARGNQWARIFDGSTPTTGPLQKNDQLYLCSPSFLSAVSSEELQSTIHNETLDETKQHVAELLSLAEHAPGGSCLIIKNASDAATQQISAATEKTDDLRMQKTAPPSPTRNRTITAAIGSVLAVLLIVSMVVGSHERSRRTRDASYQQVLGAVSSTIEEGETLVDVNPSQARSLLIPIQEQLVQALAQFPEDSKEYEALVALIARTTALIEQSSRKYTITDPEVFVDLSWISDQASGSRLHQAQNTLVTLDTKNGSLYETILDSKSNDIIKTTDIFKDAQDLAQADDRAYALTTRPNTLVINDAGETTIESIDNVADTVALEGFAGNLYILDRSQYIVKVPKTEDGFGTPIAYLAEDVSIDLQDATDMAIDGSIWITTSDNVLKFTNGLPDSFFIQDDVLLSAKALYTDEDSKFLYILEDTRVVIFNKETGAYEEQYIWEGFDETTDITVVNDRDILVLRSDAILRIERRR